MSNVDLKHKATGVEYNGLQCYCLLVIKSTHLNVAEHVQVKTIKWALQFMYKHWQRYMVIEAIFQVCASHRERLCQKESVFSAAFLACNPPTRAWYNFWRAVLCWGTSFWQEASRNLSLPSEEAKFHSFCSASAPPNFPDLLTHCNLTVWTLHDHSTPVAYSANLDLSGTRGRSEFYRWKTKNTCKTAHACITDVKSTRLNENQHL